MDVNDMQSPLGKFVIVNDKVEHSHHGSSGNYEALISFYEADNLKIVLLTNKKKNNLFSIRDTIKSLIKNEN